MGNHIKIAPKRQVACYHTHPNPDNRIERIQEAIAEEFPNGVPEGYTP